MTWISFARMVIDMIVKWDDNNNRMFKNMNTAIVDGYKRKGIFPNLGQHRDMFEQTYNVKVIVKNSRWSDVEFPDEQSYIVTALQWS